MARKNGQITLNVTNPANERLRIVAGCVTAYILKSKG